MRADDKPEVGRWYCQPDSYCYCTMSLRSGNWSSWWFDVDGSVLFGVEQDCGPEEWERCVPAEPPAWAAASLTMVGAWCVYTTATNSSGFSVGPYITTTSTAPAVPITREAVDRVINKIFPKVQHTCVRCGLQIERAGQVPMMLSDYREGLWVSDIEYPVPFCEVCGEARAREYDKQVHAFRAVRHDKQVAKQVLFGESPIRHWDPIVSDPYFGNDVSGRGAITGGLWRRR